MMNTHVRDNLMAILHPFHSEHTTITIDNTVVQTSLFTTAPVIVANDLGSTGRIFVEIWGEFGADATDGTWRVKFGGSTILTEVEQMPSGTNVPFKMEVDIINSSTSAQFVQWRFNADSSGAVGSMVKDATSAIDTTTNQTLDVSFEWSAATSGRLVRKFVSRVSVAQG
jgi:hypothetical protein